MQVPAPFDPTKKHSALRVLFLLYVAVLLYCAFWTVHALSSGSSTEATFVVLAMTTAAGFPWSMLVSSAMGANGPLVGLSVLATLDWSFALVNVWLLGAAAGLWPPRFGRGSPHQ